MLGFAGLIPFVGLVAALGMVGPAESPPVRFALLGYGATIASFLGAIHWGLVMRDAPPQPATSLLWGVAPSVLAWLALLLTPGFGLLLLAAVLWACLAVDRILYPRHRLQGWLPMRLQLTIVASIACVAGAAPLLR